MLTVPRIVDRPAVTYVALKADVTLPFDDQIPAILKRLFLHVENNQLKEAGPVFFKHNVINMPDIEMEFGVPVDHAIAPFKDFTSGVLPAGRYAETTYFGPYENLLTVNGVLIGWARQAGLIFDSEHNDGGEWFENRLEIYHNSPDEEPDPQKLQTTVTIKLRDNICH
ncbi:GyrI-like domain-containing protein [Oceaniovalibus sp. ACAM 378]|uniref:GyrI-like domain-containing protein n=1 Tax=Oceaniovalibus sp. ACAM 378 TaxID=2599923 RepID=UPI0011D51136|nr:GyrI-like domain-containing protein [Oceaniovalibus sp. ACAM 378]TYB86062.1 GyrI-like domain-containing protein [Oceaniovalibus sp. ACAM 378]